MLEKDYRGFCKRRLFCDVYVIWEKEGGFLMKFLISRRGNDFAVGFALQDGGFYCMFEVRKYDCGGLQRREWNEDDKNAKGCFASDFLFADTQLDCVVPI